MIKGQINRHKDAQIGGHFIHLMIIKALGFSRDEEAIFNILIKDIKKVFGSDASKIGAQAGIKEKTAGRILRNFEKRGLAVRTRGINGKRFRWKYKKGLEKFVRKNSRELGGYFEYSDE